MVGSVRSTVVAVVSALVACDWVYSPAALAGANDGAPQTAIWFAATEPPWRTVWGYPPNDYMQLFEPDAQWHTASAEVSVFELSKRFISETPDLVLKGVVDNLRSRHIALSIQITPLLATAQCGLGVEGHGPPNDVAMTAAKLMRVGAHVAYARMDEPLWYGHIWSGNGRVHGCQATPETLANEAAKKLRGLRAIYPAVKIIDIEPVGASQEVAPAWTQDLKAWLEAYHLAMGEPVAGLHLDIAWHSPNWRTQLIEAARIAKSESIDLGITYNGTRLDQSDQAWTDDARKHFNEVQNSIGVIPRQAVFQSWMDFPRAMLPDTQLGTLTNLVTTYAQQVPAHH